MKSNTDEDFLKKMEARYRSLGHDELVQTLMSIWTWFANYTIARDVAGPRGKAEKYFPRKIAAAEVYIELRGKNERVSAQQLLNALQHRYPEEKWNYNTLRDWHKLMKAGWADPNQN